MISFLLVAIEHDHEFPNGLDRGYYSLYYLSLIIFESSNHVQKWKKVFFQDSRQANRSENKLENSQSLIVVMKPHHLRSKQLSSRHVR